MEIQQLSELKQSTGAPALFFTQKSSSFLNEPMAVAVDFSQLTVQSSFNISPYGGSTQSYEDMLMNYHSGESCCSPKFALLSGNNGNTNRVAAVRISRQSSFYEDDLVNRNAQSHPVLGGFSNEDSCMLPKSYESNSSEYINANFLEQ